jgi:putative OPT family oligopeptide transporter
MSQDAPHTPYVSDQTNLAEITVKSVILGVLLAVILGAANAYLGLFAGMTVSASVPAAVISMAILRAFSKSNILENNAVQTAASAGESVAAGVIFTIPALVILGVWTRFDYWETTMIAGFGGILGVLFSIPLRRALIVERPLQFPEGIATAEVLKVGEAGGAGIGHIATAGAVGAIFKLGETGFRLWGGVVEQATYAGGTILYFGSNLSPALIAVGYIVGLNIALLVFIGGALNWFIAIPIVVWLQGISPDVPAVEAASTIWSTQTRYLGVGAMVIGGLWALVRLRTSLVEGILSGARAYRASRDGATARPRTDRDIPMQWIGIGMLVSLVPLYFIFEHITGKPWVSAFMAVVMLVAGFLFSAVAAYMAGLVGSSNNPISGVTIATILTSALLLLLLLGADDPLGPASAILIGAVVCCAAAMSGDNMQDLKTGYLVGATPYKQQIMQVIGVVSAAAVAAPTLTLLLDAYGIGIPTEAHPDPLAAPQATLMASVARGVFEGGLPIGMVAIGMAIAVVVIVLDLYLEKQGSNFRTPVLALAVGIYLPLELSVPIALGGLISYQVSKRNKGGTDNGILFSAGLITGEALVGIGMAIPIVIYGRSDVMAFWGIHDGNIPGIVLLAVVAILLYRAGMAKRETV